MHLWFLQFSQIICCILDLFSLRNVSHLSASAPIQIKHLQLVFLQSPTVALQLSKKHFLSDILFPCCFIIYIFKFITSLIFCMVNHINPLWQNIIRTNHACAQILYQVFFIFWHIYSPYLISAPRRPFTKLFQSIGVFPAG